MREKGHIIPATRIIEADEFSVDDRAVLSEDISMGQKWTHYGARGEYGSLNQNFIFLANPWVNDKSAFVVPYYFDPSHGPDSSYQQGLARNFLFRKFPEIFLYFRKERNRNIFSGVWSRKKEIEIFIF